MTDSNWSVPVDDDVVARVRHADLLARASTTEVEMTEAFDDLGETLDGFLERQPHGIHAMIVDLVSDLRAGAAVLLLGPTDQWGYEVPPETPTRPRRRWVARLAAMVLLITLFVEVGDDALDPAEGVAVVAVVRGLAGQVSAEWEATRRVEEDEMVPWVEGDVGPKVEESLSA
jgi:hypothetical protein